MLFYIVEVIDFLYGETVAFLFGLVEFLESNRLLENAELTFFMLHFCSYSWNFDSSI